VGPNYDIRNFCVIRERGSEILYFLYGLFGLVYNPEEVIGAKCTKEALGELSIISELLSKNFS